MEGVRAEGGDDDGGLAEGKRGEFGGKRVSDELLTFRMDSTGACGGEWPNVDYVNGLGSLSVDGSGSGHDHRRGLHYAGNDVCSVVEELTVNNCGVANAAAVGRMEGGLKDEGLNSKRSHWQHLYKLTGGSRRQISEMVTSDQGHIVLNAREELKRMSSDNQSLNLASGNRCRRDPEEVSAQLMNGYNKIMSNSSLNQEALRQNALVSPQLAQFFAANVNKGKGIVDAEEYLRTNLVSPGTEFENVELTTGTGKLVHELSIINECSLQNIQGTASRFFTCSTDL